jgi:hypothetical protein
LSVARAAVRLDFRALSPFFAITRPHSASETASASRTAESRSSASRARSRSTGTAACKPTSAILTRQAGKLYVVFQYEVAQGQRGDLDAVGIDVGLTSLVATSDGETIARPNFTKKAEKRLRRAQRALAQGKKWSMRRRKSPLSSPSSASTLLPDVEITGIRSPGRSSTGPAVSGWKH